MLPAESKNWADKVDGQNEQKITLTKQQFLEIVTDMVKTAQESPEADAMRAQLVGVATYHSNKAMRDGIDLGFRFASDAIRQEIQRIEVAGVSTTALESLLRVGEAIGELRESAKSS